MIESLKMISEYIINNKNIKTLDILLDDPESNHKNHTYKNILSINFKEINKNYEYKYIEIEPYSKEKIMKYLYKQGSTKGTDITPTSRITKPELTFNNKLISWFNKLNNEDKKLDYDEFEFLLKIKKCIINNKETILKDLIMKFNEINKKEKSVLTIKIDDKYIGDYEIFQKILINSSSENFYSKYNTISKSDNNVCYVCNEKKNVYGFVSTFKFYTVDKPGFVSGGFQQENAWKNYPVCIDCALKLELGKKYLKENLNFNFYGFNYHIIPKFINNIYNNDI